MKPERSWPPDLAPSSIKEELRPKWDFNVYLTQKVSCTSIWFDLARFSSWWRAKRVRCWIQRYVNNLKNEVLRRKEESSRDQPLESQDWAYQEEKRTLAHNKMTKSSSLSQFSPFIDQDGILRVGGRVGLARLPYDAKHPAIISPKSALSRLIVQSKHCQNLHCGTEYTLNQVRQQYWIPKGRELVKKVKRECPTYNGTNFRGAEVELRQALSARDRDPLLQEEMLKENIMWQFQPPSAPHFGGIHEALVKSSKRALYKAMTQAQQRQRLREFELRTLLSEVTGFLNSRPLTYVGGDPEDLQALIPNHFLIQRASKNLAPIPRAKESIDGGDPPVASAPGGGDVRAKCEAEGLPEKKETEEEEK
ncbi:hypothetical protein TCAL_13935, partial [Tigriopus californicus]